MGPLLLHVTIHFHDTITLGASVIAAVIALVGFAWIFYGARYRTLYEVEKQTSASLEEGREAFQLRAERVEGELRQAVQEAVVLREKIHKLEAATDLTGVLEQMHAEHAEILERIEHLTVMLKNTAGRFPLVEPGG